MKYRPEIDGLRTIAVLPVILFHSGLVACGGYVGVDIFFVISGFLITTNIVREIQDGSFTVVRFYERRARRIMPALLLVLISCSVAALLISDKPALASFGQTLTWVTAFAGNIYFWKTASYFNTSSDLNPLLHTWSLAVEEQYYLIIPLLLMATWKRLPKFASALLVFLAVASFSLAVWGSTHAATANFYLLPSRFWELLAGSFAALWRLRSPSNASRILRNLLSIGGLILIAYALYSFDENTPFPGVYALAPVLGAALIILFGEQGTLIGRFLSSRPMVLIGKISYSAYLLHQPLFAFARQAMVERPGPLAMIGLSLLSLILAYLSWRFVESPFRTRRVSRRGIFSITVAGILACLLAGKIAILRADSIQLTPLEERMSAFAATRIPSWHVCFLDSSSQPPSEFHPECRAGEKEPVKILVWGDSHAAALAAGFAPNGTRIIQYTADSCPPIYGDISPNAKYCWQINQYVMSDIGRVKPEIVVLDGYWGKYMSKTGGLLKTVELIHEHSSKTRIIVVGESPLWQVALPEYLAKLQIELTGEAMLPNALLDRTRRLDRVLEAKAGPDVTFVSALDVLCKQGSCLVVTKALNGQYQPTALDYGHLSQAAAEMVSKRILDVIAQQ